MSRRQASHRSNLPWDNQDQRTKEYPEYYERPLHPSLNDVARPARGRSHSYRSTHRSDSRRSKRYQDDSERPDDNASELRRQRGHRSSTDHHRRRRSRSHRFDEYELDAQEQQQQRRRRRKVDNPVAIGANNTYGVVSDDEEMTRQQPRFVDWNDEPQSAAAQVMASLGTVKFSKDSSYHQSTRESQRYPSPDNRRRRSITDNRHYTESHRSASSSSPSNRHNRSNRKRKQERTNAHSSRSFTHHRRRRRSSISPQDDVHETLSSSRKGYYEKPSSSHKRHAYKSSQSVSYHKPHLDYRPKADNNDSMSSSSSDKSNRDIDDSFGHFHGGPGTMIAQRYRIIEDVGLGTFGRVVKALDIKKASSIMNSSSRRRESQSPPTDTYKRYNHYSDWKHEASRRSRSREKQNRRIQHDDPSEEYGTVSKYGKDGSQRGISQNRTHSHREHSDSKDSYVAIKIVRNVKRYHDSAQIEADIVGDVNDRGGRGQSLCAMLLNRFVLPEGHYCLVFECLGPSLYDFMKKHNYQPFPLYCIRDFATQLLDALDFLHGMGLIHTDLKLENILLLNHDEVLYQPLDRSSTNRYKNDTGTVSSVQRVPVSTRIKLIDFGGATYDDEKKSSVVNTRQYRAPEVILGVGWSFPSDLWSLGCILTELFVGDLLFPTHDNMEHLALIERTIGRFPMDMLKRSQNFGKTAFDSYGWHKLDLPKESLALIRKCESLENLLMERDKSSGLVGLVSLLRSLLAIDPTMRTTAREAKKCPFCSQHF